MSKIVLSIFFILFSTSICLAQPSILFEEPVFDFGDIGHEHSVQHVFEFSNSGDQELVIEKISST